MPLTVAHNVAPSAPRAGFEPATSGIEVPRSVRTELPGPTQSLLPSRRGPSHPGGAGWSRRAARKVSCQSLRRFGRRTVGPVGVDDAVERRRQIGEGDVLGAVRFCAPRIQALARFQEGAAVALHCSDQLFDAVVEVVLSDPQRHRVEFRGVIHGTCPYPGLQTTFAVRGSASTCRAGDGNRTRIASLEGWNSAIELHPRYTSAYPAATLC